MMTKITAQVLEQSLLELLLAILYFILAITLLQWLR